MGIGVQALESELQRLRVQRALLQQVSGMGGTSGALAGYLRESDKRIQFLETHLEEARMEEPLRLALGGSEGTPSGAFCGGYYGFEVEFSYHMAGGGVTTRAGWTEFGPFGPYTKQLYVQATGWVDGIPPDQTSQMSDPFTATCCVSIETSAGAYPTFTPGLEGVGYIFGSSGCGSPRYFRAWNY
ncbi:hypothetical protein [Archangium violaceum]|nr:hypothetical protein [Archangium violaceum]